MFKYGSLFSGVGGFDLGFDQESYECVFQVEWDKNCQQILAKHWPEVPKWLDVQEVNGAEIPPCDVLTFGSPCQDLSVAGNQTGLNGDRSIMFYEATRIIQEMRNATEFIYPRVVVWENVPGALTSNNGQDFGQVLDTLANIGRWTSNGQCWMLPCSESPNNEEEYSWSLHSILEPPQNVLNHYYLSPRAAAGILRRAERRAKILPPMLHEALLQIIQRQ